MQVDTKHPEYNKWCDRWEKIRDAISGEDEIKEKGETYLPKLGGQDTDAYNAYKLRARYYNVVGRILEVSVGQVFRKDPVLAEGWESELLGNMNLAEESFNYFARDVLEEIMKVNRVGVLVDWSETQARPYLMMYKAQNIINWQTDIIDGQVKTTLIMLEGITKEVDEKDRYKEKKVKIWHELYLEDGVYKSRKWKKKEGVRKGEEFEEIEDSQTTPFFNDKEINYIPFFVLTTNGISLEINPSPLSPIVKLNLGHYVNSADYENMIHWTGTRTIIAKGWKKTEAFPVGSCAVFPADGDAHFLESTADSELKEAMRAKEEQMSVLGSAMITGKGRYVASAKTAEVTSQGEYATLQDIANAFSDSMTRILKVLDEWQTNKESNAGVTFNTDFDLSESNMQDIVNMSGLVSSNLMSWDTFFFNLKEREIYPADWTKEDEEKAIEETVEKQIERRDKKMPELFNVQNKEPEDEE